MSADHPHRAADFIEPCGNCGGEPTSKCRRCDRPWCTEHRSEDAELCLDCEPQWLAIRQFIEEKRERSTTPAGLKAVALVPIFGAAAALSAGLGGLAIVLFGSSFLIVPFGPKAWRREQRLARVHFIEGRKLPRLPRPTIGDEGIV